MKEQIRKQYRFEWQSFQRLKWYADPALVPVAAADKAREILALVRAENPSVSYRVIERTTRTTDRLTDF